MGASKEYKCPCCGAEVTFDPTAQKMKCPYCLTEFEVEALNAYYEEVGKVKAEDEVEWDTSHLKEWEEDEATGMRVYKCSSCGGEVFGDDTLAATSCPYCGGPVVMEGQFRGDLKPEMVIPFKLDKKVAVEKLQAETKKKKFIPNAFKAQIDEIKGVYVPFWLFDSKVDANLVFEATKTRRWQDSKYEYEEIKYYQAVRDGSISFKKVPVNGSSKIDDKIMESVEPYVEKDETAFQTYYLAGYLADRYDETVEQSKPRATERCKNATIAEFEKSVVGYDSVTYQNGTFSSKDGKVTYALYPVWLMSCKWQDKIYQFAMNGQTGKFVGNFPIDKGKSARFCAISTTLCALAGAAIAWLILNL